jgi:hypothetical protein
MTLHIPSKTKPDWLKIFYSILAALALWALVGALVAFIIYVPYAGIGMVVGIAFVDTANAAYEEFFS